MPDGALTAWTGFLEAVESASGKLQKELADFCHGMLKLTDEVANRMSALDGVKPDPERLEPLRALFTSHARSALLDTIDAYERQRLHDRVPRMLDEFRVDLEDAAAELPQKSELSLRDLLAEQPSSVPLDWRSRLARLRKQSRTVPLREVAGQLLKLEEAVPDRVLGKVYLFHAQAVLGLLDPWQSFRLEVLEQVRGITLNADTLKRTRHIWKSEAEKRVQLVVQILETAGQSLESFPGRLTGRLAAYPSGLSRARRHRSRHPRNEAFWRRQRGSVRAAIETEVAIVRLGTEAVKLVEDSADSAQGEHRAVVEELDAVLLALSGWSVGDPNPTPPPTARLRTAADRADRWRDVLTRHAALILPHEIETLEPTHALPSWRDPWRKLAPRQMFQESVPAARDLAAEGISRAEITHRATVREIERAREVVAYGIETAAQEPETGPAIATESVQNAVTLLQHRSEQVKNQEFSAESVFTRATAATFYQLHLAFEQGRLSLVSHLAREGGYRTFRRARNAVLSWARAAARRGWVESRNAARWFLVWIGWRAPLESGLEPVERWRYLSEDFRLDQDSRQLPLIYARLFRVEPVEDPRFLVGRDTELDALAGAKRSWENHKAATVIVTGERGSGKTSLLNCAAILLFADVTLVRAPVKERLLTPEDMRSFLAKELGLEPRDLIEGMNASRRIILLEEVERTFLRVVGGTEALRELLRILAATSVSNLWVLSMTAASFRFLNASEGLGRFFSHRINASSVEPEQLKSAILQRHNLSGLRLEFRRAKGGRRLEQWMRRRVGLVEDPANSFFDNLYVQSSGVYRSAFSFWQNHIDRAEDGVLYMQSPRDLDFEPLIRGLARQDLFTLHMIRQHGSLTPAEHARLFDLALESSQARMGHLLGREIIEPEPEAPGYRIRPEAGALVRAALSAENLV